MGLEPGTAKMNRCIQGKIHSSRCLPHRARCQEQADLAATTKERHPHQEPLSLILLRDTSHTGHVPGLKSELDNGKTSQFLHTCEGRV